MSPSTGVSRRFLSSRFSCSRQFSSTFLRRSHVKAYSNPSSVFQVSEEVLQALAEHRPVVALESTIYTHGFPYPDNVSLACHLESVIRETGGVPATVGILDGIARVGLGQDELIRLAGASGKTDTLKVSRRDLGFACGLGSPGRRYSGGTTVAGTMILAHLAGIKVFATGGLGGVHRGAENSMDISADLTELGRTPVAVISSGCKSFLDIPRTLEYLETEGVPVATFADGRVGNIDFPAFWSRDSGSRSPVILRDEIEAAAVIHAQEALGVQSGLLFANPIPETASIPKADLDRIIDTAVQDASRQGMSGSTNTPYILARIKELTDSRSVVANRALIEANVRRGTAVAKELMKLELRGDASISQHMPRMISTVVGPGSDNYTENGVVRNIESSLSSNRKSTYRSPSNGDNTDELAGTPKHCSVFVAGSVAIDLACDYATSDVAKSSPLMHTSNRASIHQSLGGVGHNVARAVQVLGSSVQLCSVIGKDLSGSAVMDALSTEGLTTQGIKRLDGARTAQYVAVNDANKDLVMAMADMKILESVASNAAAVLSPIANIFAHMWHEQLIEQKPSHLVLDANWLPDLLAMWLKTARTFPCQVYFEPVSTVKGARLFQNAQSGSLPVYPEPAVHVTTPNSFELDAMYNAARAQGYFERNDWWQVIDALGIPSSGARTQLALATSNSLVDAGIPQKSIQLLPFIPCVLTKLGREGVLMTQIIPAGDARLNEGAYAPYIISRCRNQTEETNKVGGLYMRLFPPVQMLKDEEILSVNGVGDTFLGTIVAGLDRKGPTSRIEDLVDTAQKAAVMTLRSREAVAPEIAALKNLL